jgi:type IV pilus assembly protein PilW
MKKCRLPISRACRTGGLSLIELLVAMALGLLIIAGIGQIYLAAKRSYDIQTSIAQIQEVGRFVTEVMTQDIRRAGFWGMMSIDANSLPALTNNEFPGNVDTTDVHKCNSGNDTWGRTIGEKLFGLNDTATGYNCLGSNYKLGDIITVRYADPLPVTTYDPNALYIRTAPLQASLVLGDPASCGPGSGCTYISNVDNYMYHPGFYDYRVVAHAYYVTDSTTATQCGDPSAPALPALARETLSSGAASPGFPVKTELVTGVEQLQIRYGVDTDLPPNGSVNQYMNADQVTSKDYWANVRSVRFWLLVRSDCPEGGYTDTNTYHMGDFPPYTPNDNFRRALYTATVALRN